MSPQLSTFDILVNSLSSEEAQTMLTKIAESMKVPADIKQDAPCDSVLDHTHIKRALRINDEPFFIRFWLHLKSFFKSVSIEEVYDQVLIRRIGKDLQRNCMKYIDIKSGVFTQEFYGLLSELRRSQLFFMSLLSAYDTDKGDFYLLASSFVAPDVYVKLMDATNPFAATLDGAEVSTLRSNLLKNIDETFSLMTDAYRRDMYQAAHAIEWIRAFCELPIDKALLRFTVNEALQSVCSIYLLSEEISMLASVLTAAQQIPDVVLQSLFLLSKQEKLNTKDSDITAESTEFISQAACALETIKRFSLQIPIVQVARFAVQSVQWESHCIEGGEDWFQLFKAAWKKRFNERWRLWSTEKQRMKLTAEMLALLKTDKLEPLEYRPWEDLWLVLRFKREFSFTLLVAFFSRLYVSRVQPVLKILLKEGKFYRRENLSDYTRAFDVVEKQQNNISAFIARLSNEGEIGSTFIQLKDHTLASLKSKNSLEALMKSIETEAKEIIDSTQEAFKLLFALLNGFIEGNRNNVYAPLLNWSMIQGRDNALFRQRVEEVKNILFKVIGILSDADKIETDF